MKNLNAFALLLKPKVRGGGFIRHTSDTRWCIVKSLHAPRSSSKVANAAMVVIAYTSVLPDKNVDDDVDVDDDATSSKIGIDDNHLFTDVVA